MDKPIKVAVSQTCCPDWRVPLFRELASREGIDLTVFFGEGRRSGAKRNAERIEGFRHKKLFTIPFYFQDRGVEKYRVFHPTLPLHLLFGAYDVVIVEPSTNFFNDILIFPYCELFGKKFLWFEGGSPKEQQSVLRRIIDPFVNIMIRGADAHLTFNSCGDEMLLQMGIPKEKIFRAQNTLDTAQVKQDVVKYHPLVPQLKRDLGIGNASVVLFIGAIERRKRVENLIAAVSIIRQQGLDVRALIVGDGPYEAALKDGLSPAESEFTIFAGRHTEDAVRYILASDVVVLPGQGGLAINHAFACGKPCIATPEAVAEGPSVYDYIIDGKNGFVVGIDDIQNLAERVCLLLKDKDLYTRLSQGALQSSEELSLERMVDGIERAIWYAVSRER